MILSAVLRIEHHEPMVRIQGTFNFDASSSNFVLDRESLRRDGDALVFTYRDDAAEAPVTMSSRYELDESRRRLPPPSGRGEAGAITTMCGCSSGRQPVPSIRTRS
jgi:hypothetical protein